MDGYVAKPIRVTELLQTITNVLESQEPKHSVTPPQPNLSAVNWPQALEIVQDDCQLLAEITQAFLEEIPKLVQQLHLSLTEQDSKTFQRAAHTLKSSLRYFGASEAFEVAYELECLGRDARFEDVPELLAKLEAALGQIEPELRSFLHTGELSSQQAEVGGQESENSDL